MVNSLLTDQSTKLKNKFASKEGQRIKQKKKNVYLKVLDKNQDWLDVNLSISDQKVILYSLSYLIQSLIFDT